MFDKQLPCGYPQRKFQYLAFLSVSLHMVSCGLHVSWTSPSLPKLEEDIQINDDEGWIAAAFGIGAVVGTVLSTITLDPLGRKKVILLTSVPFFVSWIMIAFGSTYVEFVIARFLGGIGEAFAFAIVPTYLGEITDADIRGFVGSHSILFYVVGMLVINLLGSYLSVMVTAIICSTLPVIVILTFVWMPESPYWFIMKDRVKEAKASLTKLKGSDDVQERLNELVEAVREQNSNTGKFLDLFTVKANRKAICVIVGLYTIMQGTGVTAIEFYTQSIFSEAGGNFSATTAATIYYITQVIATEICSVLVDKTGRRLLLFVSSIGIILSLSVETIYFYIKNTTDLNITEFAFIATAALIVFVLMYSVGLQPIALVLLGELFPTNIKAFAVGLATAYFYILQAVIPKGYDYLTSKHGLHIPFLVFTCCEVLGFIFIIFYVPETKNKTLEEIQELLKNETRKKPKKTLKEIEEPEKDIVTKL